MTVIDLTKKELPPGQQLVANNKWPIIGERAPANLDQPWQLKVVGIVDAEPTFSLGDLGSMKSTILKIDIHCVTRWTRQGVTFEGVLLEDLLKHVGIGDRCPICFL